jgi:hypothetical protein
MERGPSDNIIPFPGDQKDDPEKRSWRVTLFGPQELISLEGFDEGTYAALRTALALTGHC